MYMKNSLKYEKIFSISSLVKISITWHLAFGFSKTLNVQVLAFSFTAKMTSVFVLTKVSCNNRLNKHVQLSNETTLQSFKNTFALENKPFNPNTIKSVLIFVTSFYISMMIPLCPSAHASSLPKNPPPTTTTDFALLVFSSRSLKSFICKFKSIIININNNIKHLNNIICNT